MKNKIYSLVVLAFLSTLLSCEQTTESQTTTSQTPIPNKVAEPKKQKCSLTMGWDPWAPYQYLTPDNQVNGLEIDLISAISNEAGCELKFVQNEYLRNKLVG